MANEDPRDSKLTTYLKDCHCEARTQSLCSLILVMVASLAAAAKPDCMENHGLEPLVARKDRSFDLI
jgi:hypothetical protein